MASRSAIPDRIAPWIVLASFLALTGLATAYVWENSQVAARLGFERDAGAWLDDVRFRVETYVNVLRAAGGLFAAGENVTRDQFRAYVDALQIQRRYPGIQGVGLSVRVRPQHVADVIMDMRLNEFAEFRIWPEDPRDEYHTIVLLEPLDRRNRAAIGYDMFTNPTRREAMERARDTGEAAASAAVRLVQEIEPTEQRGFVIYVPVYTTRGVPATVTERREALYGFVYAPFRIGDLFRAMFPRGEAEVAFRVYENNSLFYVSTPQPQNPRYELRQTVNVAGRTWTVHLSSTQAHSRQPLVASTMTAVTGVIISLLLFSLLELQLRARRRAEVVADKLRKSEAELQAASRAKDEFLATLSHELRTPMTAIMGWSKLLAEDLDPDTQGMAIDAIQKSSNAQAQLIEDLLDVSRITAGKMKIEPVAMDLGPVIAAAEAAIAPVAETKGVRLEFDVPPEPMVMLGDAARVQQIIWNLLTNAVKFSDSGGMVRLHVRVSGRQAVIEVADDGQGIAPEFLPHVFERFRQADSSTTRNYAGLGLGLAIVRHLVELHGGTVTAHSEGLKKGSRFTVTLPLLAADAVPLVADGGHEREVVEVLRGARILVVDDEEDVRSYAMTVFQIVGAEVRAARSAREAKALVETWRPDVVVTDIGMPGEDGYALLRALRESDQLPVIALTAYAREEDRGRAEEAGFDAFVAKPVDPAVLRRAVADVLGEGVPTN